MYKYLIGTWNYDESSFESVWHEKLFTKEEFNQIAAKCFAKELINKYPVEEINHTGMEDLNSEVKEILIKEYGFIDIPQENVEQSFTPYWYLQKEDANTNNNMEHKLIFKYIDELLKT